MRVVAWIVVLSCASGCASRAGSGGAAPADASQDGGAIVVGDDGDDAGSGLDAPPEGVAITPSGPPFDAGPDGTCAKPLGAGDLVIDELMIASVAGTGDWGQWLEVTSTLSCAADLAGLHGECPHGSKVATFDLAGDFWIPSMGSFVVADSADPAINHSLPGALVAWGGSSGDVLRHRGTTVSLWMGGALIDSVTYPEMTLTVGSSLAFPADCAGAQRSDWTRWQWSVASWFPAFHGTPNAPNADVHCPP